MNTTKLLLDFRTTADHFIQLVSSVSDNDFNAIPFPGSWTPAQVADHIIKATGGIPDGRTERTTRAIDELIPVIDATFLNFDVKYESPEFVKPDSGPFRKSDVLRTLEEIKENNIAIASKRDLSAVCLEFEMPGMGFLTRYEWIRFFTVHTQRHIHQLKHMLSPVPQF